jgi:NAD(P)-dependent dehydrogenase (short-subunit alcohol dehydrogenase family)
VSVALVTGGSRGLGRATAVALAEAAFSVAVTGRTRADLDRTVEQVEAAGGRGLALPGDATVRAEVETAVSRTTCELGPIDLLVANAGSFAAGGRVWEQDPDQWWRDAEVNVRGPLLALHAALPGMVERGAGRVVVLGSGFGNRPVPYGSAYSASKAAVQRLVEATAQALDGTGVVVVCVSPGFVETDMTRGFPPGFVAGHPEFADPAPDRWTPPSAFSSLVQRAAAGELDELTGRFVHVTTDLDAARAAADDPERGTLRLVAWD